VFVQAICKWRSCFIRFAVVLPLLYVGSYFLLGSHTTGFTDMAAKKWYHDRTFAFDPWVYKPLAYVEQRLRGAGTTVMLDGSPGRDGSATYGFGP
jgi:hypothetical protein